MKRSPYYPSRQADQSAWLRNITNKIDGYATALGLSTAQATAFKNDCAQADYILGTWAPATRDWSLSATQAANQALTGADAAMTLPAFNAPALPATVTNIVPGALNRIFAAIQQIKDSGNCTDAIARDLGFIGSEDTGPDLTTLQPDISVSIVAPNQVLVKWGWGGYAKFLDLCELQVDRGDGKGFVPLAFDTTPNYTDTQPFPATPTKWIYRAIYRVDDQQVGLWSAPAGIMVG